jgi:hypothetical protein
MTDLELVAEAEANLADALFNLPGMTMDEAQDQARRFRDHKSGLNISARATADAVAKEAKRVWNDEVVAGRRALSERKASATLRDQFAMAALQGLIVMDTEETIKRIRDAHHEPIVVQCQTAYKFADAMMKARAE